MARRAAASAEDLLRSELDRLAMKLVREGSAPLTSIRDRIGALKTAAAWYGISRKNQSPDASSVSAWETYRETQQNGKGEEDGEADTA